MTNDLETMLRTSLHERAHDVEPTPELWRQVDRRVSRRRTLPLFVWTAAGVAAVVTAAVVGPGLLDGVQDGLVIDPAQSPSAVESPGEAAPGPVAAAPLTHYVAVADGRLVLRGVDGSESVLWESIEGGARTLAIRPGSTPERFSVAAVAGLEGMLDLVVVTRTPSETSATQTFLGPDSEDASATPVPAWSPDGATVATTVVTDGLAELVLVDVEGGTPEDGMPQQRISLAGVYEPSQLRLQDWSGDRVLFTAAGRMLQLDLQRTETGWDHGALRDTGGEDYVVDVATHPDGRLYRLLAGTGAGSGDAEDAGLGLFLDEEPLGYPDLPTADPSGVWMTAVDGGVFVGLGNDARQVLMEEQGPTMSAVQDTSYAAWIPVGGDTDVVPSDEPTAGASEAPDGSSSGATPYPYVAIDDEGRVAVHAGDGGEREVIIDEQLWAPEAGVRVLDVSVRPGSSFGEVSGVVLLATEGGPELAWFRAAAGETSVRRLEGPQGLGPGSDAPSKAPTFSPDGRHLAWAEPDDTGGWTVRTLGVDDDGPTDDDAGMGVELTTDELRVADWLWDDPAASGAVRGSLYLVATGSAAGAYELPIERQGDGALAVPGGLERLEDAAEVVDLRVRDGAFVTLVRGANGWILREDGRDTGLPFAVEPGGSPLDLDIVGDLTVVTRRPDGDAVVVSSDGEITPIDVGRPIHGFDPLR